MQVKHYNLKELPKDSWDERSVRKTREAFEERVKTCKPKLITFGEFMDLDLYRDGYLLDGVEKDASTVTDYAIYKLRYGGKLEELTEKNWIELTGKSIRQNRVYHSGKMTYLIEEYKNNGFFSIPQAVIRPNGDRLTGWMHPGSMRRHIMYILNTRDEKVILWDDRDLVEGKELTFDDFMEIFNIDGRGIFVAINDKTVEWHTTEDRDIQYNEVFQTSRMLGKHKPVLLGKQSYRLQEEDLFDTEMVDGFSGIVFETKGDYTLELQDLMHIMEISSKTKMVEKENFKIYHVEA